MLRILFGVLWRLLLLIFSLLFGLLVFIGGTETGLRGALNLVDRFLPGAIHYENLQGALVNELRIGDLQVRFGDFELNIGQLSLNWQVLELFSGHLFIEHLHADQIRVALPPPVEASPDPEPLQLPDIELPIKVTLKDFLISNVTLINPVPSPPIIIKQVETALHSEQNALVLDRLNVAIPQLEAEARGQVIPTGGYPLDLTLDWHFAHPVWGDLSGQGQIEGALAGQLTLSHALNGAASATFEARLDNALSEPAWNIDLQANSDDLGVFAPALSDSPIQLGLHSQGTLDGFSASGQARSTVPEVGPITAHFEVSGNTQQFQIETLRLLAQEHPMRFRLNGEVDLASQTVTANGNWQALAWPLSGQAQFASPQGQLKLSGTLNDFQAELDTALQGEQLGDLQVTLSANGNTKELQDVQLSLREPEGDLALNLNGSARLSDLSFQAQADWQQLRWPLTEAAQVISPDGELSAQGTPDAYQATFKATLDGPQFVPLDASAELSGNTQNLSLSQLEVKAREGKLQLSAQAEVVLATLDFSTSGDWQDLTWPMQGTPEYQSERGEFQVEGNLQDYTFTLDSNVGGAALPSGNWRLQGQGSANELNTLQILGETLEGELSGTVQARWQPLLEWQVKLSGLNLNPGVKWPDVPGKLGFELSSQGQIENGQLQADVQLGQLQGQLNDQTVAGKADLGLRGQTLTIRTLDLQAGQARLNASGELAEQWNVNWQLNVPELRGLLPQANGQLSSQGKLRGNLQNPQAEIELSARQLSLNDLNLERLDGQARLDLNGQSNLSFNAQSLSVASQNWETFTATGSGTLQQHSLNVRAEGDLGEYELALQGGMGSQNWQGQITQLSLQGTPGGDWRLTNATRLNASAQQVELARACLRSTPSELCLQGRWSAAEGGGVTVQLEQFDVTRFAEFLPETIRISNTLQGELSGQLGPTGAIQGNLDIQLSSGEVTVLVNGEPVEIAMQGGSITGQSDGTSAQSNIALDLGTIGQIRGDANVGNLTQTPTLQADLQAEINDFSIVSKLIPQVQDVAGSLSADIQINGALPQPDIQGQVVLRDGAVSVPETGTRIEDIQIQTTTSSAGRLRFSGTARSGDGELNLEGSLAPFEQQAEVFINGEKFQALDTFSIMQISPDLQIVYDQGQVRVNGGIEIPSAQLSPPESRGRSRVSPSADVIIVESDEDEPVSTGGTDIYAKLRITLDDDVWVNTEVFSAQLKGDIQVEQTPPLAPRASGSVEVVAGSYKIYGQELNIERGRILFSGGPITNPGLDLRVSRVFGNDSATDKTTVGAQIVGPLAQPELQLFSIPPMLESDIMSYMVFGRPPSGSGDENQLLYQAAVALGARRGNKLTQSLSEGLGVDLSFGTGSSLEDTELVIGKYLAPDLYVSYGVGLFEAVNTFNLRYQLTKWLTFMASSSDSDSSVDVLYTIER